MELSEKIRNIQDFPKKGILFRDITPLLQDANYLKKTIRLLAAPYRNEKIDVVVSAEARGFILGVGVAYELGAGFVPIRKPGKLPYKVKKVSYELEYGEDALEIHQDGIRKSDKVLVLDDLLATGGTAGAMCKLVEELAGKIAGVCFLIELVSLKGRDRLKGYDVLSLIKYN